MIKADGRTAHEASLMTFSDLSLEDEGPFTELVQRLFGACCTVTRASVVHRRQDYVVTIAHLAHPMMDVVIKRAGPGALLPAHFDRTAVLHQLVRSHTDVPIPESLAADVSYHHWPWRYLVATYVPGLTWSETRRRMDAASSRDLFSQLGRAVALLHTIHFPGFGEVPTTSTAMGHNHYLDALKERAKDRIADPSQAARFVALLEERAMLFTTVAQAGLTHEDLNPNNILVRREHGRWSLAAILDFDCAWAGNPESDLARLEFWRGMMGSGFWEAYSAVNVVAETYPDRRRLYQLLWCLEYASATPQHAEDTRRVCTDLAIAPFTFA